MAIQLREIKPKDSDVHEHDLPELYTKGPRPEELHIIGEIWQCEGCGHRYKVCDDGDYHTLYWARRLLPWPSKKSQNTKSGVYSGTKDVQSLGKPPTSPVGTSKPNDSF